MTPAPAGSPFPSPPKESTVLLTVAPVVMPSDLAGQPNGRLGPCNLATIHAHGWGPLGAHRLAAEAWSALQLECELRTGARLTVTSPADAYRSYEQQVATFRDRMTRIPLPGRTTRTWEGVTYWLKPGKAPCATPGTSNHGWGLAFDTGIYVPGAAYPVRALAGDKAVWAWIVANAGSFGFSWEGERDTTKSGAETWHLRYYPGDAVPQRVLDLRAWFEAHKPAA